MPDDTSFMKRALRIAALGRHASPNPMVGCVIVDMKGVKVGEGYHVRPGESHAEVVALTQAGYSARGGTAYVTLEPCSHFGRTPPCVDALIVSGIARVVAAVTDPDGRVSGRGFQKMRDAGIQVESGLCEAQSRALNAPFFKHRESSLPYVTVKTAMTLDGRIATDTGDSRWVTSPITRRWVHRSLRDRMDAILVGIGTILADNPSLTTRLRNRIGRNPLRIIVDSQLRTPLDALVITQAQYDNKTIVACLDSVDAERQSLYIQNGVTLETFTADAKGRVPLRRLLERLGGKYSVQSLLVEGGATITANILIEGLVDRYIVTLAPKIVGGMNTLGTVHGVLADKMEDAVPVHDWKARRIGPDYIIEGYIHS